MSAADMWIAMSEAENDDDVRLVRPGVAKPRGRRGEDVPRDVVDMLVDEMCWRHSVRRADLLGKSTKTRVLFVRRLCWLEARRRFGMSYPEIAHRFGRATSVVLTGIKAVENSLPGLLKNSDGGVCEPLSGEGGRCVSQQLDPRGDDLSGCA